MNEPSVVSHFNQKRTENSTIMEVVLSGPNSALLTGNFPAIEKYEDALQRLVLFERPEIMVYGKPCRQARDVGFFSNDPNVKGYRYSGKLMPASPLTHELEEILEAVNDLFPTHNFNGILVNLYHTGADSIGAHSDDERGLGGTLGSKEVVSLSVGATRNFRIRNKATKKIVFNCPLAHGCLVHMRGDFQSQFTHEIPRQLRVLEPRMSLTFRHHNQ